MTFSTSLRLYSIDKTKKKVPKSKQPLPNSSDLKATLPGEGFGNFSQLLDQKQPPSRAEHRAYGGKHHFSAAQPLFISGWVADH